MKNALTTQQLTVQIGNQLICQDLDITLNAGDICGILGPNGSGKTTLLHTLANLHPVNRGEVWLQQQPLAGQKPKAIAQQLGILFQDTTAHFSQTVLEFCLSGRHPHLPRLAIESAHDHALAITALSLLELDTKLTQKVQTLSGGERRRLAIATLLTQAPQIYLLDEPTNHLDIRRQMRVLQHFVELAATRNATVVMTLHDINIAQHFCNHILLLFGDGSSLQGAPDVILTAENLKNLTRGSQQFWLPVPII